jgi:adenylylsulfate kinase-like enzyme
MPTKHARIAVTLDEELGQALARVEALDGRRMPRARLLRDLALRGAEAVLEDDADRREKLERLAELSTSPDWLDHDLLMRIEEEAWGP